MPCIMPGVRESEVSNNRDVPTLTQCTVLGGEWWTDINQINVILTPYFIRLMESKASQTLS